MKSNIIGYYLQDGVCCLDRPLNKISYSMLKISGDQGSLKQLDRLIGVNEIFDESLLNILNLHYKII